MMASTNYGNGSTGVLFVSMPSIFLLLALSVACVALSSDYTHQITYTKRSFVIGGKPTLIVSGSLHYNRIPPSDWDNVLQLAKDMGLNCIQTYVIWSEHEPVQGKYSWKGDGDLIRFIELASQHDLYVVVRIGPYICGEYYFGGLPLWLRHVDNIDCFRCVDPIWKREVQKWMSAVFDKIQPQLYPNGGPIIMLQVENEYFKYDDYLEWSVNMARNLTTEVPWEICHDVPQCGELNENATTDKVLCAINGFWMDSGGKGNQPGPEFFDSLWGANPNQPAIWTEDQGWFDMWGFARRVRETTDQLYGIARFFAYGGAYHNFYMLSGGNNYGRKAGGQATTAYAFDTAIDSFFLRHEPRYSVYRNFFRVLMEWEHVLLNFPPADAIPLKVAIKVHTNGSFSGQDVKVAEAHEYGNFVFLSNYGEDNSSSGTVQYGPRFYNIPNHTVIAIDSSSGIVLFNTSSDNVVRENTNQNIDFEKQPARVPIRNWGFFKEPVAYGAKMSKPLESPEQLNITNNDSDYLWYSFNTTQLGSISVDQFGYDGLYYIYVDGKLIPSDIMLSVDKDAKSQGCTKSAIRALRKGEAPKKIDILSVAMGLFNGGVGPQSGKGIKSVTIGSSKSPQTSFSTSWVLKGETLRVYTSEGSKSVYWDPIPSAFSNEGDLFWLQGWFDLPNKLQPFAGGAQPNQTAVVIDLSGLNKGVAYINGFNIGRYWLQPGSCEGNCAPPKHGRHCFMHWTDCDKPTQYLYHIPFEVLKAKGNMVTLFEETAPAKPRDLSQVSIVILHDHLCTVETI